MAEGDENIEMGGLMDEYVYDKNVGDETAETSFSEADSFLQSRLNKLRTPQSTV